MEKAGAWPGYVAEPSAPPIPPAAGFPVAAARYYPPQPEAPVSFYVQDGHPQHRSKWSSGLCHCCNDVDNCCITCWCPCITFGRIAEIVDKGNTSCGTSGALYGLLCYLTGFHFLYSCTYRTKLRSQYGMPGSSCTDCLLHGCCEPCSLCQQYRELRSRGYEMEIGWQGNMDRWARNQTMAPTVPAGMIK